MKAFLTLISLACFSTAYADVVPYNLCADKTKTDCEVLHMPSLGIIDSASGHKTHSCGISCTGGAASKAVQTVSMLAFIVGDTDYSHYITFEANENNVVYVQANKNGDNAYERIVAKEKDNLLTLKYCSFFTKNIAATLGEYQKNHRSDNVQIGKSIIKEDDYNNLKTTFQAQEDRSYCEGFKDIE